MRFWLPSKKLNQNHKAYHEVIYVTQQGFASVASFGFGGQESASKPPQAICKLVIYETCVAFEKSTKMKKSIIITLFLFVPVFSFGQSSENQSIPSDSAKVYVSFIVETDGSVTNVKVDRVECPGCSNKFRKSIKKESIRVVKETPNMGIQEHRLKYVLPIKVKIEDEK